MNAENSICIIPSFISNIHIESREGGTAKFRHLQNGTLNNILLGNICHQWCGGAWVEKGKHNKLMSSFIRRFMRFFFRSNDKRMKCKLMNVFFATFFCVFVGGMKWSEEGFLHALTEKRIHLMWIQLNMFADICYGKWWTHFFIAFLWWIGIKPEIEKLWIN